MRNRQLPLTRSRMFLHGGTDNRRVVLSKAPQTVACAASGSRYSGYPSSLPAPQTSRYCGTSPSQLLQCASPLGTVQAPNQEVPMQRAITQYCRTGFNSNSDARRNRMRERRQLSPEHGQGVSGARGHNQRRPARWRPAVATPRSTPGTSASLRGACTSRVVRA